MRKRLISVAVLLGICSGLVYAQESVPLVQLHGKLTQGALIYGKAPAQSEIYLADTAIKQMPTGEFVFGFDRDAKDTVLTVKAPDGQFWQQTLIVQPREYRIQRIEGIASAIVSDNKTKEEWQRIREEGQSISQARAKHIASENHQEGFQWPVIGRISGVFGSQRVYNGKPGRPHYGVDVAAPTGSLVYAPQSGVVTLANLTMYYSGGTLIVDHGYGVSSSFLHLSDILVKVGDEVKQGEPIAKVGSSGQSTGPHLDWRINWHQQRLDPQLLVPDMKQLLTEKTQ